jgi:hypothetical protein
MAITKSQKINVCLKKMNHRYRTSSDFILIIEPDLSALIILISSLFIFDLNVETFISNYLAISFGFFSLSNISIKSSFGFKLIMILLFFNQL